MENKKSQTYSNEEQVKSTTSFLRRAMTLTELPQTPQDLPAMQIWFFTRCQSHDQAFNLLRIYQTLLIDLDFTPREIEGWLAQGHLGRNIVMHFENNLGKIPESLMMWLMAYIWIFGLEPGAALQEDVPVFKFSDEDKDYIALVASYRGEVIILGAEQAEYNEWLFGVEVGRFPEGVRWRGKEGRRAQCVGRGGGRCH
ncbi:hypothetical protein CCUS01_06533 [Colletotrichum cuscutae]|uniref:Uncharacterized protein n=1 Tax=Colletotrichum cuscutae TaxID=1209917 RepID=A0AAI9Y3K8_9PEZI|nr:hypothetical protein CCUS01_06533 [Colletotrichum cuscutae]